MHLLRNVATCQVDVAHNKSDYVEDYGIGLRGVSGNIVSNYIDFLLSIIHALITH